MKIILLLLTLILLFNLSSTSQLILPRTIQFGNDTIVEISVEQFRSCNQLHNDKVFLIKELNLSNHRISGLEQQIELRQSVIDNKDGEIWNLNQVIKNDQTKEELYKNQIKTIFKQNKRFKFLSGSLGVLTISLGITTFIYIIR